MGTDGAPGRTRTRNPWVRSPVLCPLSYRRVFRRDRKGGRGLGRATGFEPVISCATDRRLRPLGYARRVNVPAQMPDVGQDSIFCPERQ